MRQRLALTFDWRNILLAAAVAALGCNSATTTSPADLTVTATPDLLVPPRPDLAVPDLTLPPDLVNPTCTDGAKNGSETDIDCGGACAPCADGQGCALATDCG